MDEILSNEPYYAFVGQKLNSIGLFKKNFEKKIVFAGFSQYAKIFKFSMFLKDT